MKSIRFSRESELCAAFIASLPKGWVAYPETGGFDIVLSRTEDGFQIGVEAKLRLNAKVITQASEAIYYWSATSDGPDCRAVLIPAGVSQELARLCKLLGITIISMYQGWFNPQLPHLDREWPDSDWIEFAPFKRLELPDWVPDVAAGNASPVSLTDWKIRAIKIVVTLQKRGFVTRADFGHHKISMSRWTQCRWIKSDVKGKWIAGPKMPDFAKQHPVNFPQIEADYDEWKSPALPTKQTDEGSLV